MSRTWQTACVNRPNRWLQRPVSHQYFNDARRIRNRKGYRDAGAPIAEGPLGWGITPFEGNYYIRRKYLLTSGFKVNFIPGFCLYKFLYVWLDLRLSGAQWVRNLGWLYWLPNPLFPFIWFRVAVPKHYPELLVSKVEKAVNG